MPLPGLFVVIFLKENNSPFFILFFATIDFLTILIFLNSDLVGFFNLST